MALKLIDSNLEETEYDPLAAQASTTGYDATLSEVNKDTDTVSGQLNTLLSSGSSYLDRARTSAQQWGESRGLLNSSMTAGAGEAAAIDAALPIASQDASIFGTQRLANQQYQNQASQFNAASANQASMFNAGESNRFSGQRLGAELQTGLIGAQTEAAKELASQQFGFQTQLGQQAYQQQLGLMAQEFAQQKELTAGQYAQQKAMAILQGEIQSGLITTEAQYRERLAQVQGDIAKALSAQEYQQQLGAMGYQEQIQTRMAQLQNTFQQDMAKLQADLQAGTIMQADYEIKSKLMEQGQANQLATLQKQADIQSAYAQLQANLQTGQIMPAEFQQQKDLLQAQLDNSLKLQEAQLEMQKVLQAMKGEQAAEIAGIEGAYKNLIQTNASASSFYSDITKQLSLIYADPNMTAEQKGIAAKNISSMLESGLTIIGAVADLDLAGLLDFTG